MSTALTYVLIALAVVVVGVLAAVSLVRGRSRRTPTLPSIAPPAQPTHEPSSNVALVAEAPPGSTAAVEVPELDQPEPSAGRLARLRARLARSNTAVGKGLLALLTRDRHDDATWDEVEETLLASDLGVGPTQELIDSLKRRTRVESVSDAAAALNSPRPTSPSALIRCVRPSSSPKSR